MPSVGVKEVWRGKDSKPCAAANKQQAGHHTRVSYFAALNGSFFARPNGFLSASGSQQRQLRTQ